MPTQEEIDSALDYADSWEGDHKYWSVLAATCRSEKARADNLQKRLDEIATMKMRGRFGSDPFDHGRPLV